MQETINSNPKSNANHYSPYDMKSMCGDLSSSRLKNSSHGGRKMTRPDTKTKTMVHSQRGDEGQKLD